LHPPVHVLSILETLYERERERKRNSSKKPSGKYRDAGKSKKHRCRDLSKLRDERVQQGHNALAFKSCVPTTPLEGLNSNSIFSPFSYFSWDILCFPQGLWEEHIIFLQNRMRVRECTGDAQGLTLSMVFGLGQYCGWGLGERT
jgi:hypothetical protein